MILPDGVLWLCMDDLVTLLGDVMWLNMDESMQCHDADLRLRWTNQ